MSVRALRPSHLLDSGTVSMYCHSHFLQFAPRLSRTPDEMPAQPNKIQFISVAHPGNSQGPPSSPASRRRVRSHAARASHALARRLMTAEYQAQQEAAATQGNKECDPIQQPQAIIPSPVSLLSPARLDPFASTYAMSPTENFLFGHC